MKTKPSTEERAKIATMAAAGMSQQKISKTIGRCREFVKNVLAEPEIQRAVKDEKAELSAIFKEKARAIVTSIDDDVIAKGNLLQRATSAAICLDKSLVLSGDATSNINVQVLLEVAHAIRDRERGQVVLSARPEPENSLMNNPTSK